MDTKNVLILLSIILNCRCNCEKLIDCANIRYQFELGVHANPDLKTLNVGDTLYLAVNDSTAQMDNITNKVVNYSGAVNLGSFINFQEIDLITRSTKNCLDKFEFIEMDGEKLNNTFHGMGQEYRFIERNNRFLFKIALVCKQQGIYDVVFTNSNNTFRASDGCTKANFEMVFRNKSVHYELLPWFTGNSQIGGQYVFEVR
jgi:hypothetical protein